LNYGLYESASGIMASSHRLDVIANNLANSETVGFKKGVSSFQQRITEAQSDRAQASWSDPLLEGLGGGLLLAPTSIDQSAGEMQPSDNKLDMAVQGDGYFAVDDHGTTRLTRDGRFMLDKNGYLSTADGSGRRVMGADMKPISIDMTKLSATTIDETGQITQGNLPAGRVGVFAVPDVSKMAPRGAAQFDYPDVQGLKLATGLVRSGFTEQANVDPTTEMAELLDAQRQLDANASMVRMQDETLATLMTQVAKLP
jgi:flagellar basal-body rod protein FlgF